MDIVRASPISTTECDIDGGRTFLIVLMPHPPLNFSTKPFHSYQANLGKKNKISNPIVFKSLKLHRVNEKSVNFKKNLTVFFAFYLLESAKQNIHLMAFLKLFFNKTKK